MGLQEYVRQMADDRAFHARAAVTGKTRSPSMVHRMDSMTSIDAEAL